MAVRREMGVFFSSNKCAEDNETGDIMRVFSPTRDSQAGCYSFSSEHTGVRRLNNADDAGQIWGKEFWKKG